MDDAGSAPWPKRDQSGFWSGETLRERLCDGGVRIVDPYDEDCIDAASYLLSVGHEIYVTPTGDKDALTRTKHRLKDHEAYPIPPGQFALLTTVETVNIPDHAIGFIAMRSRYKFRGLINVSGFYVDPGYKGRLIFAVFNSGPATVHVAQGEPWFAIFFADLDRSGSRAGRTKSGYDHIPSDAITAVSSDYLTLNGLDAKIRTTRDDLDKRLQQVEREGAIVRWASALIITFLLALAARSCLPGSGGERLVVNGQMVETP